MRPPLTVLAVFLQLARQFCFMNAQGVAAIMLQLAGIQVGYEQKVFARFTLHPAWNVLAVLAIRPTRLVQAAAQVLQPPEV